MINSSKQLSSKDIDSLVQVLQNRFIQNPHRHNGLSWDKVATRLHSLQDNDKLRALQQMELTGGEPDVVQMDSKTGICSFFDCVKETPKGRRSLCYDQKALNERREHKPKDSAIGMAFNMGIQLLDESQYRFLQSIEPVDLKTSSWISTPEQIRKLGGAIFCDRRYNHVFVYHNGADSYYAARGFRGVVTI